MNTDTLASVSHPKGESTDALPDMLFSPTLYPVRELKYHHCTFVRHQRSPLPSYPGTHYPIPSARLGGLRSATALSSPYRNKIFSESRDLTNAVPTQQEEPRSDTGKRLYSLCISQLHPTTERCREVVGGWRSRGLLIRAGVGRRGDQRGSSEARFDPSATQYFQYFIAARCWLATDRGGSPPQTDDHTKQKRPFHKQYVFICFTPYIKLACRFETAPARQSTVPKQSRVRG